MGRGKKKEKKPVEEGMSSLSIADEPSSSTAQSATGAAAPVGPAPVAAEPPAAAPPPQKEETSEAEEGGLGLGPSKKRVCPKKKSAAAAAAAQAAPAQSATGAAAPVAPTPVGPAPVAAEPPAAAPPPEKEETPEAEEGGLGLGPSKKRVRPKKKSAAAAQAAPAPGPTGPTAGPTGPTSGPIAATPGPTAATPGHVPAPGGRPGPGPGPGGRGRGRGDALQQQPPMGHPYQPSMALPTQPPPSYQGTHGPAPAGPTQGPPHQQAPQQRPAESRPPQRPAQQKAEAGKLPLEPIKCKFNIPPRIEGRSIRSRAMPVLVNYLKMNIKPMIIYRYDVIVFPDRPKKAIPKAFAMALEQHFPKSITQFIAFDQIKNCYSVEKLPNVTMNERLVINTLLFDDNRREMKFEVSIKMTGTVDLKTILQYMSDGGSSLSQPSEAIQCIDVVLRQGTLSSYVKAGRQFFKRPNKPIELGEGVEMWTGLFQSAIFTNRPFINIDVAHKGFPIKQSLLDVIRHFDLDYNMDLRKQNTKTVRGRNKYDALVQFLKGLRVVCTIGGDTSSNPVRREFICNEIMAPPYDPSTKFEYKEHQEQAKGTVMTVGEYYTKVKKYRIQYPNLNCIWVGPRDRKVYFPMELVDVSYGQVRNRQLSEDQIRLMIREAATPPDQRRAKIDEVIRDMHYKTNPYFKKFGLEIDDQFTKVNGKLLNVPKLKCIGGSDAMPRKGVWNSRGFLEGTQLQRWCILCLARRDKFNDQELVSSVIRFGNEMGMQVSQPVPTKYDVQIRDLNSHMQQALTERSQLLIVIVPNWVPNCYSQVKKVAELHVGILTQCLKLETVTNRLNAQTVKNILLKVNSKLMGISHSIEKTELPACMRRGPFMAVGADVTHPSPEQTNIPSIAAVTASYEVNCFKYNIELSIQTPKEEIIVQFEEMMVSHLRLFVQHNKRLPGQIFVFRDGVSEGHFAAVLNKELVAIYNAYATVAADKTKKPQVLFLIVQKRHHTRFFLEKSRDNVEPGTCVDTDIVHPRELDFYMVSHQAIKGTARPTRYHVIANDANLPHDEVEQMTYYLCHMFSRCNRAVSYPAPTYYAHLACIRAKALTHGDVFDYKQLETQPKRIVIKPAVQENNRMFFV